MGTVVLDPIQRELLTAARTGPITASGRTGTGKTRLANALAADALASGKSCLLVGDDALLDTLLPHDSFRPLDPTLAERSAANSVADGTMPSWASDPVALRASVFPRMAAQARKIAGRYGEIQAEFAFPAEEIEATAIRRAPSPRTMGLLRVAAEDAMRLADVLWTGNARPGVTMGDVTAALRGEAAASPVDDEGALAVSGSAAFRKRLEELDVAADREARTVGRSAEIRAALDPWAWGNPAPTLKDLHVWLTARGDASKGAAALLNQHKSYDAAIASPGDAAALQSLKGYRRSYPEQSVTDAIKGLRAHARTMTTRAGAIEPFLERHGRMRMDDLAAVQRPEAKSGAASRAQTLREAAEASVRLASALVKLSETMPAASMAVIEARTPEELAGGITLAAADTPRTRALREASGLRAAFMKTGFGDLVGIKDGFTASLDLAQPLSDLAGDMSTSPRVLDLLLDDDAARPDEAKPWPVSLTRWRATQALPAASGHKWNVVVVDDAGALEPGTLNALRGLGDTVHLIGVPRGKVPELSIPHRVRSTELANAGRAIGERGWAGAPSGAGVVIVLLPEGADLEATRTEAIKACKEAGRTVADARDGLGKVVDIVILCGHRVDATAVVEAASRAHAAVLVIATECGWRRTPPPQSAIPGDETGLEVAGWKLVADMEDGRIYAKGGRSALVMTEPTGLDIDPETVADRNARMSAAGWRPVVAWRGAPRGQEDMLALVEANAVPNGADLRKTLSAIRPVMAPVMPRPQALPPIRPVRAVPPPPARMPDPLRVSFEDVPASPYAARTFEDVVWRLKWVREERLLRANPNVGACLLSDERIAALIRMNIAEQQDWYDRFRGKIRYGIDPAQFAVRETVFEIVDLMPYRQTPHENAADVAAVHYSPPALAAVVTMKTADVRPLALSAPPARIAADDIRIEAIPAPAARAAPPARPAQPLFIPEFLTPAALAADREMTHEAPPRLM